MCQGHPLTHLFLYVYATYAFSECNGITSFTLEDSPNTIQLPNRMFDNLRNLVTFYIGRNYTAEYDWYGNAFSNHPTLVEATIGGDATEIQNQMFNNCKVLKKVTLGDKITRIGSDAFHGCDILDDINLSEPLTEIGERAFRNCYQLRDIYCYGTVPPVCSGWLFDGISLSNMTLHYPQGSRDAYMAAVCWKEFFDDYATEFDATGINAITIDGAQNGKVYNLNGQQVDRQTIQKGLYILNGKKVMMK